MTGQTLWYVSRSSGIVAWAVLAAGVFWGVALSSRFLGPRPKPSWMLDLHRFMGALAVIFTTIHVASLVGDGFVTITIVDVLVPLAGAYRPTEVAWGIVAMYLLLAVELTSLLRRRLGVRAWRAVHMLSFPLFVVATVHMLLIGTDRGTVALRLAALGVVTIVGTATVVRVVSRPAGA